MGSKLKLNHPWLVAVWPGMGQVSLIAGFYLLAKLGMEAVIECEGGELFDVDYADVHDGIIHTGRRPRNRFFLSMDPNRKRDIVLFLGEAQPPLGQYSFCRQLIAFARGLGVERVFTFAAMGTGMDPECPPRVFGAATDPESLDELKRLELEPLEDGHIGGLNGVLLGVAGENGLHGTCLLGEMPQYLCQFPFPKASLAVLEAFTTLTGIHIDFTELSEQAEAIEGQLAEVMARLEQEGIVPFATEEETYNPEPVQEERLSSADEQRLDTLFSLAAHDRSRAFELKRELDRLGVFKEYEDRFLDLFKQVR